MSAEMEFVANPLSRSLTVADIEEIREAQFHYTLKKSKIVDRAYYIFKVIAKHFKLKIPNSFKYDINDLNYVDDDLEYEIKSENDFHEYFFRLFSNDKPAKAIINGKEYDFSGGVFPLKWLFFDFESELIEGIKKYQKKLEEKKHLTNIKKKQSRYKSKIIDRLKKSMTPEEVEIVFGKDQDA